MEYITVKGKYGHRVVGLLEMQRWALTAWTTKENADRIARLFRAGRPDLARMAGSKLGVAPADYQF